jgi:Ca2+-binding EF-hand superfamily protein
MVVQAFVFYDADQSNTINAAELRNILNAMGEDPSRKEMKAIMRKADADRNGVLQFDEFYQAVMPYLMQRATTKTISESELQSLFNAVDTDRSGSLSRCVYIGVMLRRSYQS